MKLTNIALIRTARTGRFSSWDVSGRNADSWTIPARSSRVLADIQGPGVITHIWMTQGGNYRECLLRITWDDAPAPSVLCPLGDFFGLGHGDRQLLPVAALHGLDRTATIRASNAGLRAELLRADAVPQAGGGRTGQRERRRPRPVLLHRLRAGGRSATWRAWATSTPSSAAPARSAAGRRRSASTPPPVNIPNLEREAWDNNYVILETKGRGHYLGCNLSVTNIQGTWWGEGDDMIWVDGYKWPPDLHGTGSEDYLNQAWGMQPNAFLRNGSSIHESNTGGYQTSYVHHLENPVRFEKEIKVTIEHGHANHLGNEMASVAYWYAETARRRHRHPAGGEAPARAQGGRQVGDP